MSSAHWNATVIDSSETEPFAYVGDLVLAVRTPRSRDFVTVEVASSTSYSRARPRPPGVSFTAKPAPWLADQWHGEVRLGNPVSFSVEGEHYRLTLAKLAAHASGLPWVTCDFLLERD